jgi:hypothetical protein
MYYSQSTKSWFILSAIIVMTVVFATFYFSESPWGSSSFQIDSEALVTRKILAETTISNDFQKYGGFLYAEPDNVSALIPGIYTSQVGFQGMILSYLQEALGIDVTNFIGFSRIIVSLLFAGTIALVIQVAWVEFGIITSVISLTLVIASFWLVAFSKNLYWVVFTLFLPYALGWYIYPKIVRSELRLLTYLLITAGLILLKSLNGYEYITNVILGATIAPIYYEFKAGTRFKILIRKIVLISLAGIAGFILAYTIHFIQLYTFTRDLDKAVYILTERAAVRTIGNNPYKTACDFSNPLILLLKYLSVQSILRTKIPLVWMFSAYLFGMMPVIPYRGSNKFSYFCLFSGIIIIFLSAGVDIFIGRPGFGISQIVGLSAGISVILFGFISLFKYKLPYPEKLIPLVIATTWALLSSFTWVFLAKNHMACHIHLNPIVFYLPFGITLFLFLGFWLQIIFMTFRNGFNSI